MLHILEKVIREATVKLLGSFHFGEKALVRSIRQKSIKQLRCHLGLPFQR